MKKIYLLALCALTGVAFAQAPKVPKGPDVISPVVKMGDPILQSPVRTSPNYTPKNLTMGKKSHATLIGQTQNDQQTNASIYRRIQLLPGGKVSATWTTSADASPYATRGSGYNHFNGTAWGAVNMVRIEPERTGFPCYVYRPAPNEEEIITSHIVKPTTGIAGGIMMNRKPGVGPGTWTSTTVLDTTSSIPGALWNQTAIAGDYMIVIASYTDSSSNQPGRVVLDGIRTPQVYSRYQFSTNTWLVKNQLLPGYDNSRVWSGGGDNYSIDARGNTVAILMGGLTDDLSLWKSTDAGGTWTKTIIDSFSVPAFNYKVPLDTTYTNDGAVNVSLDANGMAHCFWALAKVVDLGDTTDGSISYYPGQNAILYWKEGTPTDSVYNIGGAVDADNNGTLDLATNWNDAGTKYGNHSIATMPFSAISDNGVIYVIFSALTEGDASTDNKNFRDVYCVYSYDNGNTWSSIKNLTSWLEYNVEQIFASASRKMDGRLHMTFLQKGSIGRYDPTNNPGATGPYNIMYMAIDTADISGTLNSVQNVKNELFSVAQNFPNPFSNMTNIPVNFTRSTDVTVKVMDLLGKEIYNNKFNNIPAGSSQLEIKLSNMSAGIYVYQIEAEGFKVARKMIVD